MKIFGKILGVLVAIIAVYAVYVFVNKLYYPPLPISGISAKETIDILQKSESKVAEIAKEGDSIWYITRIENRGIMDAEEAIKQMVFSEGWEFKEKDGSGLFFEKDGERLIATTEMWTKNYVLVNIPRNFKE